jgi:hypothetical protein
MLFAARPLSELPQCPVMLFLTLTRVLLLVCPAGPGHSTVSLDCSWQQQGCPAEAAGDTDNLHIYEGHR